MIAKTLYDLWRNPGRYSASDKERAFLEERSKAIAERHSERFRCLLNVIIHADEKGRETR